VSTYLAASEVTLMLPRAASITDSSVPLNLGEIATWCYEVGAEFDGAAAAVGYDVPLTPSYPAAYAQARGIVRDGVSCRIARVLMPNMPGSGQQVTVAEQWCRSYAVAMKALREGGLPLVDAPQDPGGGGRELPRSYETSNPGATAGGASPLLSVRAMRF
jgi:hypothetical protein